MLKINNRGVAKLNSVGIVVQQTVIMFLMIGVGYWMFRSGRFSERGSKDMASLMVSVVIPAVILNSFLGGYSAEKARVLIVCTLATVLVLLLSVAVGWKLFGRGIDCFAATFSNPGFFGLPLISAAFGEGAVLYATPFVVGLNILQFSYGVSIMRKEKSTFKVSDILKNPIFLSAVIGVVVFASGIQVHAILTKTVSMMSNLNGPVAMLVMGAYLAQTNLSTLLTRPSLYAVSAVRMLLIPALTLLILWKMPLDISVRQALLICSACPVGANVAVYAQLNDLDSGYAVQTVIHSTVLCILTIPLVMLLAQTLWGI